MTTNSTSALVDSSNYEQWGLRVTAALCMMASVTTVAQAEPIESVTVSLSGSRQPLPAVLAKRMTAAVQTAADKLYVGTDTEALAAGQATYQKVTTDIIDRILYGYTVESLTITPGVNSHLTCASDRMGRPFKP